MMMMIIMMKRRRALAFPPAYESSLETQGLFTFCELHLPSSKMSPRMKTMWGLRSHSAVWKARSICHSLRVWTQSSASLQVSFCVFACPPVMVGWWMDEWRCQPHKTNPLPPQFVEPVSSYCSQEVRIRQHHGSHLLRALYGADVADLRPGALENGREVDEILAEEEDAADRDDQHHGHQPCGTESQHFWVILRRRCPGVAHWCRRSGPWGIFQTSSTPGPGPGPRSGLRPWDAHGTCAERIKKPSSAVQRICDGFDEEINQNKSLTKTFVCG